MKQTQATRNGLFPGFLFLTLECETNLRPNWRHCHSVFIVERTKFDFSRPRKVETPGESSNVSGLEMEVPFHF